MTTLPPEPPELAALPPCLDPRQTAGYLGLCMNTTYALLNTGELKGRRIGRQWRIPRSNVWEFLCTKTPPPASEFAKYAPARK